MIRSSCGSPRLVHQVASILGLLTLPRPSVETGIGLTACPASGAAQAASIMTLSTGTSDSSCLNAVLRSIPARATRQARSEEHTSELPSLMSTSYAVFCLTQNNPSQPHLYHIYK